jgi:hypothetical protein
VEKRMEMNAENHISNHNISINYWTEEYLSKPPLHPNHLSKVFNQFNDRQKCIPCFRPFLRYPWHFPPEKSVLTGIYITIGCQFLHPKNSTHYPFVWGKFHCKHAIIYLAGTKCVAVAYVAGIAFSFRLAVQYIIIIWIKATMATSIFYRHIFDKYTIIKID